MSDSKTTFQRSRNWLFTNYAIDTVYDWSQHPHVKYAVYQEEVCPNTGRHHHQGYVELDSSQRMSAMRKMLPQVSHWDPRRGTQEEARTYCTKEETRADPTRAPIEYGTYQPNAPGKSKPLQQVLELVLGGESEINILKGPLGGTYVQHMPKLRLAREVIRKDKYRTLAKRFSPTDFNVPLCDFPEPNKGPQVLYFIGPPKIGKTKFALAHFKSALLVKHIDTLKDFDETIHDGIVFDDMRFNHWPASGIIALLDSEEVSEINCRYCCAILPPFTKKIFTSNVANIFEPHNYKGDPYITDSERKAIERRYTICQFYTKLSDVIPDL